MEEKKQYSALTIDRAAFLLLRVKKAFKKKRMQRKEKEKMAQLSSSAAAAAGNGSGGGGLYRIDQRASCAGFETHSTAGSGVSAGAAGGNRKQPPPLLRSRTLPAIVVPGVNILQAQLGNYTTDVSKIFQVGGGTSKQRFHPTRISFSRDDNTIALDHFRRKSAVSKLCVVQQSATAAGGGAPNNGTNEILLKVPSPSMQQQQQQQQQTSSSTNKQTKMPSPNSSLSNNAFNRLSKLLNQSYKSTASSGGGGGGGGTLLCDDTNVVRRLSWERKIVNNQQRLPRSSSIDSMVEAVWAECVVETSPSQMNEKRQSIRSIGSIGSGGGGGGGGGVGPLLSPSMGRRMKGQRGINELPTLPSECAMEVASSVPITAALPPPGHKPSKKQAKLLQQRLERLARVNIHLHALFAAVEHGHMEKARTILESTDVDVNCTNGDGLSPLDVAVLSNNRPLVRMLINFGAKESAQFGNPEKLGCHLKQLLGEAEMRLQEFGGLLDEPSSMTAPLNTRASFSIMANNYPTTTGCVGGDNEKQALVWGRRAKTLKRLVLGYTQTRPPDPPSHLTIDIISSNSVSVKIIEATSHDSSITTKFNVQWSLRSDFTQLIGEIEINDITHPITTIQLIQGRRYYFRAACGNIKGYGGFLLSTPMSVVPSTWKELDNRDDRFDGKLKELEILIDEVRQVRPGSEMLELPIGGGSNAGGSGAQQRRGQRKKTTIKQLFSAASKFQKNLRRGIYLACILYNEDKVLVTNEDFLPVIEIDETFPSCIHNDLHWFMKVACTWNDTKSLRNDMEKHSSSAIHFRTRLLTAALQMQSTLCIQDLGQLYYKPIRDARDGATVVLSTINYIKTPKNVSVLNSRWLPMNKVMKKMVFGDDHSIGEILMSSIQEQINYHQVSSLRLSRGLYVAYLKMQSSVDLIQVVVPAKSPNMLPHCKVRENPHVSADEWKYLKQQDLLISDDDDRDVYEDDEQQRTFLELITSATKRLLNYMDISMEEAQAHRLYDTEIIELNSDISFIVICPSAELSCSVPGQREILLQRGDLLSLPIQVFEIIHLNTYQYHIIQRYARLNCLLELDAATANHLHREAFSNSEVALAKERVNRLQQLQAKLNAIWRCVRWLMDVITFARDRALIGISIKYLLEKQNAVSPKRSGGGGGGSLLQLPSPISTTSSNNNTSNSNGKMMIKATPGRGSWPGPAASLQSGLMNNEFSKSEQHLNKEVKCYATNITSATTLTMSTVTTSYFNECLAPSRSEDMLFSIPSISSATSTPHSHHQQQQRTRASTVSSISATSSPLLSMRPMFSGGGGGGSLLSVNTTTSDSMHSLSSDSDYQSPIKSHNNSTTTTSNHYVSKMAASRSMTNVKQQQQQQQLQDANKSSDHYRPRNLNLDPGFHNVIETHLSKSLTNIHEEEKTYLKPMMTTSHPQQQQQQQQHNEFKVPANTTPTTNTTPTMTMTTTNTALIKEPTSGILQVYAAYETGLASGTSLKLHVTPKTTAREVVDLVVKQLNMAVVLKGKEGPIYSADKLRNFCLVAVIGARERCLRDDFKPLQLQNPWKKGRLYVRQKQDVLAALEHSTKHSAII